MTQEELFDQAAAYDEMLHRGLRLAGEHKRYFIEGRLAKLECLLPASYRAARILDFGCGTGDTSRRLHEKFGSEQVVGVDVSDHAITYAAEHHGTEAISFSSLEAVPEEFEFDLCYCNGAFHHIPPLARAGVIRELFRRLRPGGMLALFENNPLNPGTRLVMSRIPFDRDAQTLRSTTTRRLLSANGFELVGPTYFLFVFPAALKALRFSEKSLERLPLGAQYLVLARRPEVEDVPG